MPDGAHNYLEMDSIVRINAHKLPDPDVVTVSAVNNPQRPQQTDAVESENELNRLREQVL